MKVNNALTLCQPFVDNLATSKTLLHPSRTIFTCNAMATRFKEHILISQFWTHCTLDRYRGSLLWAAAIWQHCGLRLRRKTPCERFICDATWCHILLQQLCHHSALKFIYFLLNTDSIYNSWMKNNVEKLEHSFFSHLPMVCSRLSDKCNIFLFLFIHLFPLTHLYMFSIYQITWIFGENTWKHSSKPQLSDPFSQASLPQISSKLTCFAW